MAMAGIAFLFPLTEIEPTFPAPPARKATNPPSGAGADWLTARCFEGGVIESTQGVLEAAEPPQLTKLRTGSCDAHVGRPVIYLDAGGATPVQGVVPCGLAARS